jgi:mono/diheme cytochrome c family protein
MSWAGVIEKMNGFQGLCAALTGVLALFALVLLITGSKTQAGTGTPVASATSSESRTTYGAKCAKCHGKNGRGKTTQGRRTHARDLTTAQWQNDVTDERLFNSISNGRGKKMPSFKKELSEADIDALVAYVRRLKK